MKNPVYSAANPVIQCISIIRQEIMMSVSGLKNTCREKFFAIQVYEKGLTQNK